MQVWDILNRDRFWTDSIGQRRSVPEPAQRTMIRRWIQAAVSEKERQDYLDVLKLFDARWVS